METRYPQTTVEQAFEMFDQDTSVAAIGKSLTISRRTIARWRDDFGWIERREGNRSAAGRELNGRCLDRRVELAEKAQEAVGQILDSLLQSGPYPTHVDKVAKAALDMTKTLHLLTGAPTEVVEERIITVQDLVQAARERRPALREGEEL